MISTPDNKNLPFDGRAGKMMTAVVLVLLLLAVSSCQHALEPGQGKPTPEAPVRAVQPRHQYRYYPDSAVYMDTGRRLFFYRSGEKWLSTTLLPASIRVDWKNYVILDLDTDKPYQRHSETVKRYPPKSPSRPSP